MKNGLLLMIVLVLSACSQTAVRQQAAAPEAKPRLDPVLFYTERLADQLLTGLPPLPHGSMTAVTFTDSATLQPDHTNVRMRHLGLQLQESMLTVASQLGYQVTEFRAGNALQLHAQHDSLLTRQLSELAAEQSVRYVIAGTLSQHEDFTIVNARLVDTETNRVVAAAADQIPTAVLGSAEQVQLRQQRIYRSSH
ncbi:FlgO family outer membrane protein [Alkalimonas sp. MEB108]|uniref:FlgO family outer membrane protein n=1 Tax=Alkalimonas cellulosilytica TaxID=3058395 RepID=A0ABU7J0Z8_9GAMM|nr:FlgO family outer membrane protein [Alkalimonas sp. MEB108]MEE2000173.1 FlgO family outer membrane protein [Alkalimonas sp. MEB108]